MDFETILLIFKQVFNFLVLIFIGYVVRRKNVVGESAAQTLAKLLTWVFAPLYSVVNLSKNVSIDRVVGYITNIGWGLLFTIIFIVMANLLAKIFAKDSNEKGMFTYMFSFCNLGYFGYPFIKAVFGEQMLVEYMLFGLSSSITLSVYGYYILTKSASKLNEQNASKSEKRKEVIKRIISPPIIGTLIGITLGLLPINKSSQTFTDIVKIIEPVGNCMSPCAMILTGIVLAKSPLKDLFSSVRAYLISLVRLVGIPLVAGAICILLKLVGVPKIVLLLAMCLSCFPAGMNVVVYPESVGLDSSAGAKPCFISYILAIITVPIVLSLVLKFIYV